MNRLFMEKVLNYFSESLCKNSTMVEHVNFPTISYQFQSVYSGNEVFPPQDISVTLLHLDILISIIQFSVGEPGFFLQV